jgi:hypothetical protein
VSKITTNTAYAPSLHRSFLKNYSAFTFFFAKAMKNKKATADRPFKSKKGLDKEIK